jgi:hypothetical protein
MPFFGSTPHGDGHVHRGRGVKLHHAQRLPFHSGTSTSS